MIFEIISHIIEVRSRCSGLTLKPGIQSGRPQTLRNDVKMLSKNSLKLLVKQFIVIQTLDPLSITEWKDQASLARKVNVKSLC